MDQKTFEEEQQHLTDTYQKLEQAEADLEKGLADLDAKTSEEKNDILTNIRYDTADDEVLMESYGEIQNWNHYIDSYNTKYSVMNGKLQQVKMLLESPYFARVTLRFAPDEEPEDYYIGRSSYSENGYDQLIVDWRSPIAETYYNQENGKTSYQVDGRTISVDLELRRQFDLSKNRLNAYFDTQLAIQDPLLLESLSRQRSDKMQAITTTIQKEQNAVIRYPDVPVMLVNGIAGSGKTSVLLQRIAYLFYRKRKTLRPENVTLMTLNPVFRDYIDEVLPDLGERNPVTLTWMEFLQMVHDSMDEEGLSSQAASLREMEEKLPSLRLEEGDFKPIMQKKTKIVGTDRILAAIRQHDGEIPTGVRLIQVTAADLEEEVRKTLRVRQDLETKRRAEELEGEDVSGEEMLLRDNETEETVERHEEEAEERAEAIAAGYTAADDAAVLQAGSPTLPPVKASGRDAEDGAAGRTAGESPRAGDLEKEERQLRNNYGGAFQQTQECGWLDIDHIGQRLLGKRSLTSIEWFYLKMLLTGECSRTTEYVCIDEVQDYTEAQLMTLRRYYPNARFMLLGDAFQSIREGTVSFRRIPEIFGTSTVELPLLTSYRSTPEITSLFAGLLPEEQKLQAQSVQREGVKPLLRAYHGNTSLWADDLAGMVRVAEGEMASLWAGDLAGVAREAGGETESGSGAAGLTAILCADRKSQKRIQTLLQKKMGEKAPAVIGGEQSLPKSGTFLITLALAKGLEFDRVIIPDADPETYGTDLLSRHRLYTAISRATRELAVLSPGELTKLLD